VSTAPGFAVAAPSRRVGYLPVVAVVGSVLLGGIAVVSPVAAVGLVFAAVFVLVAFRSLTAGLALFTVLIFLEYVLFGYGAESLIKLAGGVLATAWAAQVVARRGEVRLLMRDRPFVSAALLGLVLWAFASSLWAEDSAVAMSSALRLSQAILLVFIVYTALGALAHFRRLVGAYVMGTLLAAGFGLASLGASGRLGGDAGNPNELAAFFLPAIMLCAFALLGERRPLAVWATSVAGLLLLFALLMTGSRGGLIGLSLALLVAIVVAGRGRLRVAAAMLVVLGGVAAYYATTASPEQVERLGSLQDDGGTGREDLWAIALAAARDRPVGGVGAGNFPVVEAQYAAQEVSIDRIDLVLDKRKVVHNTYLGFLSELGLVGFSAFVFLVLAALGSIVHTVRRARGEPWRQQALVRGFLAGLLGMLVAFAFASAEYEKQLWLLMGTAFALPSIRARDGDPASPLAAGDGSKVIADADYHLVVRERPSDGHGGEIPGKDVVAEHARLARREAALAERERATARREQELRQREAAYRQEQLSLDAERGAAAAQRERLGELETRVAELEDALARGEAAAPVPTELRTGPSDSLPGR
jgi:O-antigen ligase